MYRATLDKHLKKLLFTITWFNQSVVIVQWGSLGGLARPNYLGVNLETTLSFKETLTTKHDWSSSYSSEWRVVRRLKSARWYERLEGRGAPLVSVNHQPRLWGRHLLDQLHLCNRTCERWHEEWDTRPLCRTREGWSGGMRMDGSIVQRSRFITKMFRHSQTWVTKIWHE